MATFSPVPWKAFYNADANSKLATMYDAEHRQVLIVERSDNPERDKENIRLIEQMSEFALVLKRPQTKALVVVLKAVREHCRQGECDADSLD